MAASMVAERKPDALRVRVPFSARIFSLRLASSFLLLRTGTVPSRVFAEPRLASAK